MVETSTPCEVIRKDKNRLITVKPSHLVFFRLYAKIKPTKAKLYMKGNTVGSFSEPLITDNERAYIFGLWCADGYYRASSIGITNVDKRLVDRFAEFFKKYFLEERIKLRTYYPVDAKSTENTKYRMRLAKQVAYQLYVNSRPLLRLFLTTEQRIREIPIKYIAAYFAGRFDGDGSVAQNLRTDLRITYSNLDEAEIDQQLLQKRGNYMTSVYHYKAARTYILYVHHRSAEQFLSIIYPFSVKLQTLLPRRDLSQ